MSELLESREYRDEEGNFMGTLEVTMDIKPLQAITGEKRIMDN